MRQLIFLGQQRENMGTEGFEGFSARYFTGKPCKAGHLAERYASTGGCVECLKISKKKSAKFIKLAISLKDFAVWPEDFENMKVLAIAYASAHWVDIEVKLPKLRSGRASPRLLRLPCHDDDFPALLLAATTLSARRRDEAAVETTMQDIRREELEHQGVTARRIALQMRIEEADKKKMTKRLP